LTFEPGAWPVSPCGLRQPESSNDTPPPPLGFGRLGALAGAGLGAGAGRGATV